MCKPTEFHASGNAKTQPCDLCVTLTDNYSRSRDLHLCQGCENGLRDGKFAAAGIQQELRTMRQGIMLVDRAPLPKFMRHFFEPFPLAPYDPVAAEQRAIARRQEAEAKEAAKLATLERLRALRAESFGCTPPAESAPAAELDPPAPAPIDPTPDIDPVAPAPKFPRPARPRRNRPAPASQPAPAEPADWRQNARRLALAVHV